MAKTSPVRFSPLFLALLALSGCSLESWEHFGHRTLQTLGLESKQEDIRPTTDIFTSIDAITPEQEYFLGRAVTAKLLAAYKVKEDPKLTHYVNLVGQAVASFSAQPDTFSGYHFAVLDTDEVNAMSAPGGIILISRGLLNLLPSEEALAAVLAHEVVHVPNYHGIKSISKEKLDDAANNSGIPPAALGCSQLLVQGSFLLQAAADDITDRLSKSGYSQELEFEADSGAVEILRRAGYDVTGILQVLTALGNSHGASGGWFSTHPSASERENAVATLISVDPNQVDPNQQVLGWADRSKRFNLAMGRN